MSRIAQDLAASASHSQPNGNITDMQSMRRIPGRVPTIAIVGAGISGLRCADILIRSGAKVTVFEARDRVGGRLYQQSCGGSLVDMGPNWIHGTKENPMLVLTQQTATAVMDPEEKNVIFDSEGNKKTIEESNKLSGTTWELILDAFKYSDEYSSRIDPKVSLYDYFKERLSERIKDEHERQDALNESRMWGPFIGDPIDRQSLKFFFLEEMIDGENLFVASTYRAILNEIARAALQANIIKFNTEVAEVEIRDDQMYIKASDGEVEQFDDCVITCPLGWLKQHHSKAFKPPLPPRLTQAISSISYGHLEKVYVTFPTAFWLSDGDTSTYPNFTHFHPPNSHPAAPPSARLADWNQSIVSLAHLPQPHSHATLLFYIYGDCAYHVVKSIAHLQPQSPEYKARLNSFAEPFYSKFPNYDPSKPACVPVSFLGTTWSADKFAGNGSYSNFQVGLTHADEDIECMRDAGGLTGKGLWLAGEHTAPFVALGTTTGAWWSGEAVARRLCQKHGLEVPNEALTDSSGPEKDLAAKNKQPDTEEVNGVVH